MDVAYTTVLFMGPPGSGKGTQAARLATERGWMRVSSGDQVKAIRDGSGPFSAKVRASYDKGMLLPDWFADYLLEQAFLDAPRELGIVAEGFARTERQAKHWTEILAWLDRPFLVVHLDLDDDTAVARMVARGKVEDRPDSDSAEEARGRLASYARDTAPAIAYFEALGVLRRVDGAPSPEVVHAAVIAALANA